MSTAVLEAAPSEPYRRSVALPFVQKIGQLANEVGFADAVVETFHDAGITFELAGDLSAAAENGLLIASDHRQRLEPLLVQALTGMSDRGSSHVLATPNSFAGAIMQSSGQQGKELVIPVIPGIYASENRPSLQQPRKWIKQVRSLQIYRPREELRATNRRAVASASQKIGQGGTVTICPAGSITEAGHNTWRQGIGHIVQGVQGQSREQTQIAVFRPDTFSRANVISALLLRDLGIRPKRQTIVLGAALLGTIHELFPQGDTQIVETAQQISNQLRDGYRERFKTRL